MGGIEAWAGRSMDLRTARRRFLSDTQGREQQVQAELALDGEGRFLAIRAETFANIGAYLSYFSLLIPTIAGFRLLTGAYRIPAAYVHVRAVHTNTVWVDAYRGAGRPETAYILERLVDAAARETGLARDEIRRRNFVPRSAMPYKTPMIVTYDSGDFPLNLETRAPGCRVGRIRRRGAPDASRAGGDAASASPITWK